MAQILRTQAKIDRVSGITADAVMNTFHHSDPGSTPATALTGATAIHASLATFYQDIDVFMASTLGSLITFKTYNLSDAEPRVPVLTTTGVFTKGATACPGELAVCLSYNAAAVSGVPVGRTRGRIYIGPLTQGILGSIGAGDVRPNLAQLDAIRVAGAAHGTRMLGSFPWIVWSATSLTGRPIVNVSTDDAFDVQRRRGSRPTARVRTNI